MPRNAKSVRANCAHHYCIYCDHFLKDTSTCIIGPLTDGVRTLPYGVPGAAFLLSGLDHIKADVQAKSLVSFRRRRAQRKSRGGSAKGGSRGEALPKTGNERNFGINRHFERIIPLHPFTLAAVARTACSAASSAYYQSKLADSAVGTSAGIQVLTQRSRELVLIHEGSRMHVANVEAFINRIFLPSLRASMAAIKNGGSISIPDFSSGPIDIFSNLLSEVSTKEEQQLWLKIFARSSTSSKTLSSIMWHSTNTSGDGKVHREDIDKAIEAAQKAEARAILAEQDRLSGSENVLKELLFETQWPDAEEMKSKSDSLESVNNLDRFLPNDGEATVQPGSWEALRVRIQQQNMPW